MDCAFCVSKTLLMNYVNSAALSTIKNSWTSFQFDPREQTSMETESKSYFFIHENLFEYVVY